MSNEHFVACVSNLKKVNASLTSYYTAKEKVWIALILTYNDFGLQIAAGMWLS